VGKEIKSYALDANAVMCLFEGRAGADKVESLLDSAEAKNARIFLSTVNLAEIFYSVWKIHGEKQARFNVQQIVNSPIQIISADFDTSVHAAELKAKYRCGLADAFAASLAFSKHATLVTADPDFRKFGDKLRVIWLPGYKSVQ
jgi:predicted nucleic acid-binding protein